MYTSLVLDTDELKMIWIYGSEKFLGLSINGPQLVVWQEVIDELVLYSVSVDENNLA